MSQEYEDIDEKAEEHFKALAKVLKPVKPTKVKERG